MKLAAKWLVSLLIAAFFVYLSSRQWPVSEMVCSDLAVQSATLVCFQAAPDGPTHTSWTLNALWLLPAMAVLVLVHFLRVLRWAPLIRPLARFDFPTLNRVGAVSFLALFVFPLRLGELARPYLIAGTGKLRKSAALGSIAVERVLDGLMMALVLALVLFALPADRDGATYYTLRAGATVALVVFAAALGLLVLAYVSRGIAVRIVERTFGLFSSRLADRLGGMMGAFIDGLKAMPSVRCSVEFVVLTMIYWAVNAFYFYFVAMAFDLADILGIAGAYAMMSAVAVGMMIPNSPANVGSFWYFLLLPLGLFPASPMPGAPMAFALTVWGLMLVQYALFAGYFMVKGEATVGSLWSVQKERIEQ